MLITEIFRNYAPENGDNAECVSCGAGFTVPEIAAKRNASLACPNCGKPQTAKESIAARQESDANVMAQAPDLDPHADSEWAAGKEGS
ncbi:MAG: hypothetical protein JXR12_01085 [Neptunomonas phycophila]|uniref:hypothetical protein n=1 Tax=Neptunomonas phycophila TaxID=1572645 RepID=UPI003B8C2566